MNTFKSLYNTELSKAIGEGKWLTPAYYENPIQLGTLWDIMVSQSSKINEFYSIISRIAQKALISDDRDILKLLFSEAPAGMDIEFHKKLPSSCWNAPIIYRTDQALSGLIYEIQAPGSGWGDLYLYAKCLKELGFKIPDRYFDFPNAYINNIVKATGKNNPKVFHMTDAASVPYSIKYLQAITSSGIHYWGLSPDVKMDEIDCLLAHSATSIVTSNYFKTYIERAKENHIVFGISPNLVFDEKVIYLLPFYRKTRDLFSDDIRQLFPFTTIIEDGGFIDIDDRFVSIEEFVKRPSREKLYYLKYGGPDTNRNWGSRSVYRLDKTDSRKLLSKANELSQKGEIWLLQKDVSKLKSFKLTDDLESILKEKMTIKISGFYGMSEMFGVKVMARHFFKVHGQKDTFVGLGI